MARNTELIRQWQILQTIGKAHLGVTIRRLAECHRVSTRTIRRDLAALVEAGFPLYDEKVSGTARWRLDERPFRALAGTSFGVVELCALYFSRSVVAALAGTPFRDELAQALGKIERVLPDRMKHYLDRLPGLVWAKPAARKRHDERRTRALVARLLDASLHRRRARMRYHSFSSRRIKEYVIEPYRLVYAHGGIYLSAYVEQYHQIRTFALERIRTVELLDTHFDLRPGADTEPFAHSLGVHTGPPTHVEIVFDARVADYILEREWHPSQRAIRQSDGSVLLALEVSIDHTLRSFVLGFGARARVVSPPWLAEEILDELEAARDQYAPRIVFDEVVFADTQDPRQPELPLRPLLTSPLS
jgi:predicted DNA-binding transcriptional regulator YafY